MKYDDFSETNYDNDNTYKESDGLKEYYKMIDGIELLSASEEQILARKIKEGDQEAKNRFIEANLRLVRFIAGKSRVRGISMDELIQEGNLALIKAVETFDPDKGYRFSTYAIPWIKVAINKAIANDKSVIKKNAYAIDKTIKYNKCVDKLAQKLNHMPSKYEIADELGVSVDDIDKLNLLMQGPVSLDSTIGDSDDMELSDLIANPNVDVENEVVLKLSNESIQKSINENNMTKNEMMVMYYFFGLDGNEPKSQAEIGRIMNLSRVRIGQILSSALKKLNKNEDVQKDLGNNTPSYEFDNKTKKILKKIQLMMDNDDYEKLKLAIINARCDKSLDSISSMELIISLLGFGYVGKRYAPIEIANILCFDYNSMKVVINGVLSKYSSIFSKCEKDKTLYKK